MAQPPSERYPLLRYIALENDFVDVLDRLLRRAAREIAAEIAKEGRTALSRGQLQAQAAAIKAHLAQDWSDIGAAIKAGQRAAAEEATKVVGRYERELLTTVLTNKEVDFYIASMAENASRSVETLVNRLTGSRKTLSERVYDTRKLANGYVDDAINTALLRNMNGRDFARYVRNLISPDTPGGVSYAAKRLARTELNNAFHAVSNSRYRDSGIVEEVDWHLSTSHPEGDVCDERAADSPYPVNKVPEKPHPQCLCFTTPVTPTRAEFIDNLFAGKYGDEPWFDDSLVPAG